MKRNKKFAFLGVLFAFILALVIFSTSYLGIKVNAAEGEIYVYEDSQIKSELTIIDETTMHFKDTDINTGTVTEEDRNYIYYIRANYYEVFRSKDNKVGYNIVLDETNKTFADYVITADVYIKEDVDFKVSLYLIDDTYCHFTLYDYLADTRTVKEPPYRYNEDGYYELMAKDGETIALKLVLNKENKTLDIYQPPLIDEGPTLEDYTPSFIDEAKNWIIALIVSFLGSTIFYLIWNLFLKKGKKAIAKVIDKMVETNIIGKEQAENANKKVEEITEKIDQKITQDDILINEIKKNNEINEAKKQQMDKLLENLLPDLEEGNTNEKEE